MPRLARSVFLACALLAATRGASATPPPTEAEAKAMRERAALTECVHCAGRGDFASKAYRDCRFLEPYGLTEGASYWDQGVYGKFWCRPRTPDMVPLPAEIAARAEDPHASDGAKGAPGGAPAPPRAGGCAGCAVVPATKGEPLVLALPALALGASLRRVRRPLR